VSRVTTKQIPVRRPQTTCPEKGIKFP
jgi:hypothetical protein